MSFKRFQSRSAIVLSLLLITGVVILGACKKTPSEKAGEKMASDILSKATGGKAAIDFKKGEIKVKTPDGESVIIGGGGTWPVDLPEDIIKFEAGRLKYSSKSRQENGNTWAMIFENVDEEGLTGYLEELKGDGWKVLMSTSMESGSFTQAEKDKWNIVLSFNKNEKSLGLNIILPRED